MRILNDLTNTLTSKKARLVLLPFFILILAFFVLYIVVSYAGWSPFIYGDA